MLTLLELEYDLKDARVVFNEYYPSIFKVVLPEGSCFSLNAPVIALVDLLLAMEVLVIALVDMLLDMEVLVIALVDMLLVMEVLVIALVDMLLDMEVVVIALVDMYSQASIRL